MKQTPKNLILTINCNNAHPNVGMPIFNVTQGLLYNTLLPEFTRKEAIFIGCSQYGMHTRTVEKALNLFIERGILQRVSRGHYRKISLPDTTPASTTK